MRSIRICGPVDPSDPAQREISLVLVEPAEVRGRIFLGRDSTGTSIQAELYNRDRVLAGVNEVVGAVMGEVTHTARDRGDFHFPAVLPGEKRLTLRAARESSNFYSYDNLSFSLAPGESLDLGDLFLEEVPAVQVHCEFVDTGGAILEPELVLDDPGQEFQMLLNPTSRVPSEEWIVDFLPFRVDRTLTLAGTAPGIYTLWCGQLTLRTRLREGWSFVPDQGNVQNFTLEERVDEHPAEWIIRLHVEPTP